MPCIHCPMGHPVNQHLVAFEWCEIVRQPQLLLMIFTENQVRTVKKLIKMLGVLTMIEHSHH